MHVYARDPDEQKAAAQQWLLTVRDLLGWHPLVVSDEVTRSYRLRVHALLLQRSAAHASGQSTGVRDRLAVLATRLSPEAATTIDEIGHAARLHTEEIVAEMIAASHPQTSADTLAARIDKLSGKNGTISGWFGTYLHSLRALGNASVHAQHGSQFPLTLSDDDLLVLLEP